MAESQETEPTPGEEGEEKQTPAAEGSAARTFTQEEVDAIVKRRLDRLNGKHASDTDELERRIAELEAMNAETAKEAAELKAAKELADWQATASAETGVPASLPGMVILKYRVPTWYKHIWHAKGDVRHMTFDELTPYHGKSVTLEAVNGERYEGVAVIDDEERDMTLYCSDYMFVLRPEQVVTIEFADEA